jgi:hypothetical protein
MRCPLAWFYAKLLSEHAAHLSDTISSILLLHDNLNGHLTL